MKIVNRQVIPQMNHVMNTMGVTVYKFAPGLFGLQIDFTGLLQRIDYCCPSIGRMQPLVTVLIHLLAKLFAVDERNMMKNFF